jgi:hypothetical protein
MNTCCFIYIGGFVSSSCIERSNISCCGFILLILAVTFFSCYCGDRYYLQYEPKFIEIGIWMPKILYFWFQLFMPFTS